MDEDLKEYECTIRVWFTVIVEAENKEEARKIAVDNLEAGEYQAEFSDDAEVSDAREINRN